MSCTNPRRGSRTISVAIGQGLIAVTPIQMARMIPAVATGDAPFRVVSEFEPAGDQPKAIAQLSRGVTDGERFQTLLGLTGCPSKNEAESAGNAFGLIPCVGSVVSFRANRQDTSG